ncbi:pentapeptide repeat-containing protein [Nocardioides campestrisoli]|uniref:pentapeptide repeat-containing protein n=1 Tax=Nocardioides campestrisoli TaxID=2736757 RepID=UPI001CD2D549|nr:pentapeptide repeat-containing protein [Nocardioides campestrisoli]
MIPLELAADCGRCAGLCCVLAPFRAADGFGVDKPSGTPCSHLDDANRCSIHDRLRTSGWPGCTVFDCFGAGQHVTQSTYAGTSWRDPGVDRSEMAAVLSVMRQLHEAVRHLDEAQRRAPDPATDALLARVVALTDGTPTELLTLDLGAVMADVGAALRVASAAVRGSRPTDLARADLAGRDLRGRDLRGADLHGALLLRADLRDCDLAEADLLGADVRDADLRGADLSTALFLTQPQVNGAVGDGRTLLPVGLERPGHWSTQEQSTQE